MDKVVEENPGIPLAFITLEMWKQALIDANLASDNKTEVELKSAEARFRQLYQDVTYQSDEVQNQLAVVDKSNNFVNLTSQIAMFPEIGERFSMSSVLRIKKEEMMSSKQETVPLTEYLP